MANSFFIRETMNKRLKIFDSQNSDSPFLNVIFDVEGRAIYADQMTLASASEVFEELFIQRGNLDEPVNQPIRIDGYTYNEFYRFLHILYSGFYRKQQADNFFALIMLADYYKIKWLKSDCEEWLECKQSNDTFMNVPIVLDEFYDKIEFAQKYGLKRFKRSLPKCFKNNFAKFVENDDFMNLDKAVIKALAVIDLDGSYGDRFFTAVYKWAESRALNIDHKNEEKEENFDLASAVLNELADILPHLKFENMTHKYLLEFVAAKGLITIDEANEYKTITVDVTCKKKIITGSFLDDYEIFEYIKAHKQNVLTYYGSKKRYFWKNKFTIPSTPSEIKKMKGCEWYLLFDKNGILAIKHRTKIERSDYLLAEMKAYKWNQGPSDNTRGQSCPHVSDNDGDDKEEEDDEFLSEGEVDDSSTSEDDNVNKEFMINKYDEVYATVSRMK